MAGMQNSNVVDLVGQAADGTYVVIMVEERPWGADPAQARQLRDKIEAYAGFILDGGLARRYPEVAGRPVRIQLDCPERPDREISRITDHAAVRLDRQGIGFSVRVLPGLSAQPER
jgi:hypothetical protein